MYNINFEDNEIEITMRAFMEQCCNCQEEAKKHGCEFYEIQPGCEKCPTCILGNKFSNIFAQMHNITCFIENKTKEGISDDVPDERIDECCGCPLSFHCKIK